MALSDVEIQTAMGAGDIVITPFDQRMLQPASYDLKVGKNAATVGASGDPRVDLEQTGVLLIPAYAPAVIWTHEEIGFSKGYVGHFGLKSKLARRGLNASVGMQIDPGFLGPLSVTLINMTPNPISLGYKDDFVTLEIDKLEIPASRGYQGEYQGRKSFTSNELEAVLGFKGHALTDVVKGFNDIREAIEVVAQMSGKLDTFMGQHRQEMLSMREFMQSVMTENKNMMAEMKKLVSHIVGGDESRTIVLRTVTREDARAEILALYKSHDKPLFYSDVAESLQLDLELVLEISTELEREGLIGENKE